MNLQKIKKPQTVFFRLQIFFAAGFILLLSFSIFARSLDEYRQSVRVAKDSADELSIYFADEDDETVEKNSEYERELVALIRSNLPATEKIEWQGAAAQTNNAWLSEKLAAFEQEESAAKRAEILTLIGERLATLQQKLDELENPPVSDRTKDEDKQKLAEILRREEYQKPEKSEESLVQKLIREFKEWFENILPRPAISESTTSGAQSLSIVLQILLYTVVIAIIGFLLYKFAPLFIKNYRGREKSGKRERVILGEQIAADASAENLFTEAEALARSGNLRAAIRKGYIALLCDLSDRKIIGLAKHKTNRDYLRDLRRKPDLYENMNGLTSSFERHWYGFEATDEQDWNEFRQAYKKIVSENI
jgi:hypothetical protein